MDNNDILFEKIENYLRGKMSAAEAADFERQIAADPELAEMVDMQRFEQDGLEFLLEEDMKRKIEAWKTTPPPGAGGAQSSGRQWQKWVAGLLVVLVATGLFFFLINDNARPADGQPVEQSGDGPAPTDEKKETPLNQDENKVDENRPTPSRLQAKVPGGPQRQLAYAESVKDEKEDGGIRTTVSEKNDTTVLSAAIRALADTNYNAAIRELLKINAKEHPKEYHLARRLLGRAYFKAGRYADAAGVFQSIAASNKAPAVKDKAEWDLLLSLLSDYPAQKAKAEKLLDEITATAGHRYAKRARELKAELAKIRE